MAVNTTPPNATPAPNYYTAQTTVHDVGSWHGGTDLDHSGSGGDHKDVVLRDVRDLGVEGAREKYRQQAREKYLQPGNEDRTAYWREVADMDKEIEAAGSGATDFNIDHAALTPQDRGEAAPTLSEKDVADMDAVWFGDQPDLDKDGSTDDHDDALKVLVDTFGPEKALAYANKKIDESTVYSNEAEREAQRSLVAEQIKTASQSPVAGTAPGQTGSDVPETNTPASITPAPLTAKDTAALDQTWAKNYNVNNDWAGDGDAETEMDKTAYSVFQHGAEKTLAHGYARISEDPQYTTVAQRSAAAEKWKQQVTDAVPLADTFAAKNGLGSGADTAAEPTLAVKLGINIAAAY
jgi:hypothetical protein